LTQFSVPFFQSDLCWLEYLTMLLIYEMVVMILEIVFFAAPSTTGCTSGYFQCDFNDCFPLAKMCDQHQDCYDGFDESNCDNRTAKVYQVQ
jgi:hypothetical protein